MAILIESSASSSKRRPKYQQMADQFREQVRAGVLKPGDQLPSFALMAAEFGIGQATLERTYAILESERLIVRQHGRGIFVAGPSPAPAQYTLGILTDSKFRHHPYYVHVLNGAIREAESAGVEMMLLHENSGITLEKLDGLLFVAGFNVSPPALKSLRMVELIRSNFNLPAVVADDYDGARQATEYLISLGHRRIAFMTQGRQRDAISAARLRAYTETLGRHGIEPNSAWVRSVRDMWEPMGTWAEMGRKQMERWFAEDWDSLGITAILAQNDETAIGIIETLQASGREVPGDVSVVGFDGYEIADYFRPRLTTVQVPLDDIGAHGARLLMEQIRGSKPLEPGPRALLPTTLRLGDSTAPVKAAGRGKTRARG